MFTNQACNSPTRILDCAKASRRALCLPSLHFSKKYKHLVMICDKWNVCNTFRKNDNSFCDKWSAFVGFLKDARYGYTTKDIEQKIHSEFNLSVIHGKQTAKKSNPMILSCLRLHGMTCPSPSSPSFESAQMTLKCFTLSGKA